MQTNESQAARDAKLATAFFETFLTGYIHEAIDLADSSTRSGLLEFLDNTPGLREAVFGHGAATEPRGSNYIVQAGDTLGKIAAAAGTDVQTIAQLNNIQNPDLIFAGQQLVLPPAADGGFQPYRVQPGDTLSGIAQRFGSDWQSLARVNNLADPDMLSIGQTLQVPSGSPTTSTLPTTPTTPPPSGGGSAGGVSDNGLQFIYDHEALAGVSERLHWPGGASGVTLGPGYDMKGRSAASIEADMIGIGIDPRTASRIAGGAGLSGQAAANFARNNAGLVNLSPSQAQDLLGQTVEPYARAVRNAVDVPLTQNQFDALTSFAYNIGIGGFEGSSALRRLNAGDYAGAAEAMKLWNKSGGDVVQGLVNRRRDEVNLFNTAGPALASQPEPAAFVTPAGPASRTPDGYAAYIEQFGDAQAQTDFDAGRRVVVALRTETSTTANGGVGVYDDHIAIVWKDAGGNVQIREFAGNTEPSAQYRFDGPKADRGSHTDLNGDGRMDLGRMVEGTTRFRQEAGTFLGNSYFRATQTQRVERDTNQDGLFTSADPGRIDSRGAGRSMLIHQGGSGNTWSAGCQTMASHDFNQFLSTLAGQTEFSYVLVNAN